MTRDAKEWATGGAYKTEDGKDTLRWHNANILLMSTI